MKTTVTRKTTDNYEAMIARARQMDEQISAAAEKYREDKFFRRYDLAIKELGFETVNAYTRKGYAEPANCLIVEYNATEKRFVKIA